MDGEKNDRMLQAKIVLDLHWSGSDYFNLDPVMQRYGTTTQEQPSNSGYAVEHSITWDRPQ